MGCDSPKIASSATDGGAGVCSRQVLTAKPTRLTDEQVETISRAVADPKRFAMLRQIARGGDLLCVALDAHQCLSPATISHHLTVLQHAGLVQVAREGRNARLTLQEETWQAYLKSLASL